jgi:hypothetical protein
MSRFCNVVVKREDSGGMFTIWAGPGAPNETIGAHTEPPSDPPQTEGLIIYTYNSKDVFRFCDSNADYKCDVGLAIQFDNERANYIWFNNPWIGQPWIKVNGRDKDYLARDSFIDITANYCHFLIRRNQDSENNIEFEVLIKQVTP